MLPIGIEPFYSNKYLNMNKFITAVISAVTLTSIPGFAQQNSINNPMTQAMFEVYTSEIAANPNDPDLYYRRANEYYKFNQYLRALSDVDKALQLTTENDRDLRFLSYMLRAEIYQMTDKHREALSDFSSALALDPTSFMALYQKANEEYELGDYSAAKADYTRMRAINPRSPEALTGLARVAVKENNLGLASEFMDDAVELMPSDSDVYIRRASVRRMLNNNTGAVQDLLMAISIDNNTRAFQELIDIANEDYPAVISGLSTSITYAPRQGMLYYIRGFIAQAHDHFLSALADYKKLIDDGMYEYAGLYNSIAQCQLALCKYPDAMNSVDNAISMDGGKNPEFYVTKARIYYAQNRMEFAEDALKEATSKGKLSARDTDWRGIIDFGAGEYDAANELFGGLIIDQPDVMRNYIYRAWVLNDGMKQTDAARNLYNRVVGMTEPAEADPSNPVAAGEKTAKPLTAISTYRGFALLYSGDKDAAVKWGDDLLRDYRDTDGYLSYMVACLYANCGDNDRAFSTLEKALQLGYGNLYELTAADYGRVSIAPLRSDSRFNVLLARYSHLFEKTDK